ncbi:MULTISPECIES: hypothetical protein [Hoylesella]|nr:MULTISPECIES: hypothetical protein [Hoylesella]UWP48395.1 hypothetical protein NQ518_07420 [Hoylesella buccalis ATCC 35310]
MEGNKFVNLELAEKPTGVNLNKILTWQNPEQLFVAQVLKKFNL